MRTFIALNIPEQERQRLDVALAPLREKGGFLRWMAPESYHLTLKFLGDVEGSELDALQTSLQKVVAAVSPMRLRLEGVGAFPSLRRANVVWVGVDQEPALMKLQREVELSCSRLGYAREQRPFRPHVTVARLQSGARPADLERHAGVVDYNGEVEVASVELMHSRLGPAGARYDVLRRWPLGRPSAADGE